MMSDTGAVKLSILSRTAAGIRPISSTKGPAMAAACSGRMIHLGPNAAEMA